MFLLPRLVAALCGMLLFGPWAFAAKNDPLSRLTPVPAGEPVPLMDFIRPLLFVAPSMNEAGTHVAALAPIDAERIGAAGAGSREFRSRTGGARSCGFPPTTATWAATAVSSNSTRPRGCGAAPTPSAATAWTPTASRAPCCAGFRARPMACR